MTPEELEKALKELQEKVAYLEWAVGELWTKVKP